MSKVRLEYVSNPQFQQFVGAVGELYPNIKGGYDFVMDNGKTISTTTTKPNSILGDLEHPCCKEFSFHTNSGTIYVFETNLELEKLFDGCRKDNEGRFLGFEK